MFNPLLSLVSLSLLSLVTALVLFQFSQSLAKTITGHLLILSGHAPSLWSVALLSGQLLILSSHSLLLSGQLLVLFQ